MSSEPNSSSRPDLPQEEISARARRLWENAGCPADRDLEFWLEAETVLRRERNGAPAPRVAEAAARTTQEAGTRMTEPTAEPAKQRSAGRRR